MAHLYQRFFAVAVALFSLVSAFAAPSALKTINTPQGGQIVYGQVDGAASEAAAMGAVLRAVHNQFGDKPEVGKIFRVHGTSSVAVFFTVVRRSQGNRPWAGMVIASTIAAGHVEAAVISDDAARFGATINPMLNQLFGAWHPGGAAPQSAAPASAPATSKVAPLHQYVLPDKSASASLPEGWKVLPSSGGGTIMTEGPNGEGVSLGFPLRAFNSSDPRVQKTMQWALEGTGRNTGYAKALYYPYGQDLAKTFVDLLQMRRGKNGQAPLAMQITKESPLQVSGPMRCAQMSGQMDAHDGKGLLELNSVFCQGQLSPTIASYNNVAYHTAVPVKLADQERATMGAIMASFTVDMAIVGAEANAIAAPAIAVIQEVGRRAATQAADAHAAEDAHNRAVEQRWDSLDKGHQAFSNYLLEQTVIQDNDLHAHGTVWNQTADEMVKSDPKRYEYVNTPNFWKGIDY
jgi:hypothetical protein